MTIEIFFIIQPHLYNEKEPLLPPFIFNYFFFYPFHSVHLDIVFFTIFLFTIDLVNITEKDGKVIHQNSIL